VSRTCLLVVAAAGYGKTTALQAGAAVRRAIDLDPADLPAGARLAIDDLDELAPRAQAALLRAVAPDVQLTLASRAPLGPAARGAVRGPVRERGPADLALSLDHVASVLRVEHGIEAVPVVLAVHEFTAGWPALVHLAADGMRGDAPAATAAGAADALAQLAGHGSALASWLAAQVIDCLPARAAAALDAAVQLDAVCAELLPDDADGLLWLRRTGLLVPYSASSGRGALRVVPALGAVLAHRPHRTAPDLGRAAGWYEQNGYPLAAARTWLRAGERRRAMALVETRGPQMLAAGGAVAVAELADGASRRARLVKGDALRMSGDPAGATRVFAPLLRDRIDAPLAWRAGMVQYMLGDFRRAVQLCDAVDPVPVDVDGVHVLALRANALGLLGESAEAVAVQALEIAQQIGDDGALAAAHIAAANASTGTRRDTHLTQAAAAAERAGDLVQLARVLVNQADALLRDAQYDRAVDVAVRAVRAAERGGPPGLLMTALCNAGDALLRTGDLDAAAFQFERALDTGRAAGLGRMAMGLWGRAEVHRERGHDEEGAAAYEEAIEIASAKGDLQVLVPSLTGLSRLLLACGDAAGARARAERAEALASPELSPLALVARGWAAVVEGDVTLARDRADEAARVAREARASDTLAESLVLAAAVCADPVDGRAPLGQALALWDRAGARLPADRVRVSLGGLPGADPAERARARAAARRLRDAGVRLADGHSIAPAPSPAAAVTIAVLGGFDVAVDGAVIALPAWKSRQARTLVKILVARRGRVVPRLELRELIWSDDDFERTAHRLSVLLSVVRSLLDPAKAFPADHYIRAAPAGICLDLDHVRVDVEEFLHDAAHVLALEPGGDAVAALAEVEAAYRGDVLAEDVYDDWAEPLREQARTAWLQVLGRLAVSARAGGDVEQATTALVRLIGADPYDEPSYRALVRTLVESGRHGEARRVFERWASAMRSIDAPLPDEAALTPR